MSGNASTSAVYYQHSGTIGPLGPVAMTAMGLLGAVLGGAIYGIAIFHIPYVYLNALITLAFGGVVGYLVGVGATVGKVRNPSFVLWGGVLAGLVAEYAGWVSWVYAASGQTALVLDPASLGAVLSRAADQGVWSLFGWTPTGVALYAIWFIEGVLIVGMCALVAVAQVRTRPFCEDCSRWMVRTTKLPRLQAIADPVLLKHHLEQANYALLESLGPAEEDAPAYTRLSLAACPSCDSEHYLTVKAVQVKTDRKGETSEDEDVVVENLALPPEVHARLSRQWSTAPADAA